MASVKRQKKRDFRMLQLDVAPDGREAILHCQTKDLLLTARSKTAGSLIENLAGLAQELLGQMIEMKKTGEWPLKGR